MRNKYAPLLRILAILAGAAAAAVGIEALGDEVETTFEAGFSGTNIDCGTMLPSAYGTYDRDSDDVSAHAYVRVGPGGSCQGSVGIDVEASKRHPVPRLGDGMFVAGVLGFDQRTNSYEVESGHPATKAFHAQTEQAATAAFGIGRDFGDWRLEIGANLAAEYDDRLEPGYVGASGNFDAWEFDLTLAVPESTLRVQWEERVTVRLAHGTNDLGAYDGAAGPLVALPPTLRATIDVAVF